MKFPQKSQLSSPAESPLPARSLLLQSALMRGAGVLVLCGALAAVLVWATRPMA